MDKCDLFFDTNVLNTPFCVILQYTQTKKEILCQKEKQHLVKMHD